VVPPLPQACVKAVTLLSGLDQRKEHVPYKQYVDIFAELAPSAHITHHRHSAEALVLDLIQYLIRRLQVPPCTCFGVTDPSMQTLVCFLENGHRSQSNCEWGSAVHAGRQAGALLGGGRAAELSEMETPPAGGASPSGVLPPTAMTYGLRPCARSCASSCWHSALLPTLWYSSFVTWH